MEVPRAENRSALRRSRILVARREATHRLLGCTHRGPRRSVRCFARALERKILDGAVGCLPDSAPSFRLLVSFFLECALGSLPRLLFLRLLTLGSLTGLVRSLFAQNGASSLPAYPRGTSLSHAIAHMVPAERRLMAQPSEDCRNRADCASAMRARRACARFPMRRVRPQRDLLRYALLDLARARRP